MSTMVRRGTYGHEKGEHHGETEHDDMAITNMPAWTRTSGCRRRWLKLQARTILAALQEADPAHPA
jgi:hypothetical protein